MEDINERTGNKRVFINDVDTYSSKHIAQFLSTCVVEGGFGNDDLEDTFAAPLGSPAYQIVGTSSTPSTDKKESCLLEIYTSPPYQELLEHLLKCDVVIYNISENATQKQIEEATWAITALHAEMDNFVSQKIFILVSSLMTWAKTRPQSPNETDVLFTEEEFRRRKPHRNYKTHHTLEKLVLKLCKKSVLSSYVVACGLQYGKGESLFHYFFKVSWLMQFPYTPLFGKGQNYIPTIHVSDLGGVLQNIIELEPKPKYILAVDDSKNTLQEIVMTISDVLGPGRVKRFPREEAITMNALKQEELDCLSIDLQMDSLVIKDSLSLNWISEAGLVENIDHIVEEYKQTRQLLPIRICLVGPPAVGKTTISEKLCKHYQIQHIRISEVIEEKISQLKDTADGAQSAYVSDKVIADANMQLENINQSMEANFGRLDQQILSELVQEKLYSKPCINQGFLLDGFLKTYHQAKQIFSAVDAESDDSMFKKPVCIKKITPEHFFALNATDDFLKNRVQGLPQKVVETMSYTPEEFLPRLARYRKLSSAEETLPDFFDELEIHPEQIEITRDDIEYRAVMKMITEMVGTPKNYGLSPEEQLEADRKKEMRRKQILAAEAVQRKHRNETALAEMAAQYEEWQKNLSEVKRQECELLEAHSLPLRNYLMKYVMPSLIEALSDCCKIRPEDPVDYVAEYLLRNNQQEPQSEQ